MKSIQSKILLVVISGLLVITAVVSGIAVTMTHEIMHKDADRILNNVAQKEAAYINDILGDIQKSAAIMEHYASAEISDVNQLTDLDFREKYLQKNKKMFEEIALNTNGIEGFYMRLNPEYTTGTTGFYNLIRENSIIQEMQVTDLSKYDKNDAKNVGWYYTPIRNGHATWLDPYRFPGNDALLISYSTPLYLNSQLLGVIGFDMRFDYLLEQIDKISVYENGWAALLNEATGINYSNVPEEESDEPHTKATATLKNGMTLELRADYKDIQKDIRPMMGNIVIAFLIVLFFSILYTILVTHRIVRPLKRLTAAAEKLALGTEDGSFSDIPVESKDEIGTLSVVLKETYEKIREYTAYINALAYRDSLTGIKNSTAYTEAVNELNKEINRNNPQFRVLIADINNLKQTNDEYGHDIGNELIIHSAKILTSVFKTSSVFRIGGDEFAVLLRNADYDNYRSLIEELDEACAQDFISLPEHKIPISLARGIATYTPEIDAVYQDVFAKADHAMYLNKQEQKMARVVSANEN